MKKITLPLVFVALGLAGCKSSTIAPVALKTDEQKFSYALGRQIGDQLKSQNLKLDPEVLKSSIGDTLAGKPSQLSEEEMMQAYQNAQKQAMAAQTEKSGANQKIGAEFLAANKAKKDIVTTSSGLQYRVITAGKGKMPKATDTVRVHYKGHLIDGTEFDSSYARNEPVEFPLNGVIKGWTEALQLMKEGSKWELFIPSDLAYGPTGRPKIPGGSTLIFEVELLNVVKKK